MESRVHLGRGALDGHAPAARVALDHRHGVVKGEVGHRVQVLVRRTVSVRVLIGG